MSRAEVPVHVAATSIRAQRWSVTLRRGVAALVLVLHAIAHLAVYPITGTEAAGTDEARFWVPMSLQRDPVGISARVLLVAAAVGFGFAAVRLLRLPARNWSVPAVIGSVASIAAVALLWNGLHPRPSGLIVGPSVSAAVLAIVAIGSRERHAVGRGEG